MYELNITEFQNMPYPPFDNSTPMYLHGFFNGSTPIQLNTTGYLNCIVEVRGMDLLLELMTAILIIMIILLGLAIWDHYQRTWGGRKNL